MVSLPFLQLHQLFNWVVNELGCQVHKKLYALIGKKLVCPIEEWCPVWLSHYPMGNKEGPQVSSDIFSYPNRGTDGYIGRYIHFKHHNPVFFHLKEIKSRYFLLLGEIGYMHYMFTHCTYITVFFMP